MTAAPGTPEWTFGSRLSGALRLQAAAYEDVEHDRRALPQALLVVVLSSASTGLGSARPGMDAGFLPGTIFALSGWLIWASLIFVIGAKLLPEPQTEADVGQLLRTTGFAAAPGLFGAAGLLPGIGPPLLLLVSVWMLLAMLTAVRQALDFTNRWRAFGVVLIGWTAYLAVLVLARLLL